VSRERCHQREAERSGIDADFGDARNQIHAEGDNRAERPVGEQQSGGAPKRGGSRLSETS
jgi:hypothetical protein